MLPPSIIEDLVRRSTVSRGDQNTPSIPLTSTLTIADQNGVLEISNLYDRTVDRGQKALQETQAILQGLRDGRPSPLTTEREVKRASELLRAFQDAALMVREVHTRNGMTEYETINNLVQELWRFKKGCQTTGREQSASISAYQEGVMIGFNLAGINKTDPTYRTGSAVKLLIALSARKTAPRYKGSFLGMWGTGIAVGAIGQGEAEPFRKEVLGQVMAALNGDQSLPAEVARELGVKRLGPHDLPARDWIAHDPNRLGLKIGHQSRTTPVADIQPGRAEISVIRLLEGMSEAEAEATRLGRTVFFGEVPDSSPAKGTGFRSLLKSKVTIAQEPHQTTPVKPGQFHDRTITPEDITEEGLLPRPTHEAGHSVRHHQTLASLLSEIQLRSHNGPREGIPELLGQTLTFIGNPEGASQSAPSPAVSMGEILHKTYQMSLRHQRLPVYRLEFFPKLARQVFGGKKFFIQMAEYKDYWGHNRTHLSDKTDSLHRLSIDILAKGYAYHGVDLLVGTQERGDEIYFAIGGEAKDPRTGRVRPLTEGDIAQISDYLATHFNRIFENLIHHQAVKVLPLPGGRHNGRSYVLKDDQLIVERRPESAEQVRDLLETVKLAYGVDRGPGKIVEVENLSQVADVARWRLWQKTDTRSGKVIKIFHPDGMAPPEGYIPVEIPLSTTLTPAVEVPSGSSTEVVRLAMSEVGKLSEKMKREGVDRPVLGREGEAATETAEQTIQAPPPVVKLGWLRRLQATTRGHMAINGGIYLIGDAGSDLLMGETGRLSRLATYPEMLSSYLGMLIGTKGGEIGMRALLAGRSLLTTTEAGERTLNRAVFNAKYKGARGYSIHGGGMLGAILALDLLKTGEIHGGDIPLAAGSMGVAMTASRGTLRFVRAAMEGSGIKKLKDLAQTLKKPSLPTLIASTIIETLVIKGIGKWGQRRAEREISGELRSRLAGSLWNLDRNILQDNLTQFKENLHQVIEAFGDYLMFLELHHTAKGRALLEAQMEMETIKNERDEFFKENPPERDRLQAGRIGITKKPPSLRREELEARLKEAEADYRNAEAQFQEGYKKRLLADLPDRQSLPVYAEKGGAEALGSYKEGLKSDSRGLYSQLLGYLESREVLLEMRLSLNAASRVRVAQRSSD